MKKQLLFIMLSMALGAIAADATQFAYDGLLYEVNDYTHATVIGCADPDAETIRIPYVFDYEINGQNYMFFVTKIADNALADSKMTTLVFEEKPYAGAASHGDMVIGAGAFNTSTLTKIVIDREDLPVVEGDPFSKQTYDVGAITFGPNISEAVKDKYLSVSPWNKIGAGSTTSVTDIEADHTVPEYFTLNGTRVYNPDAGIYIVRRGTVIRKEFLR